MKSEPVDVSEFEAANSRRQGTCSFEKFPFTPEQRAKLDAVLFARPDISHAAIARVLAGWGLKVDAATVARHRRQECLCGKDGK